MSIWVDLGNGQAIDASRIDALWVDPPIQPSHLRDRTFVEQLTWTVSLRDRVRNTLHIVGYYWSESGARSHAHRIVTMMLEAARD